MLWLLTKLRPDHKTIADFRTNNLKPLRQVCRPVTRLCQQLDRCGAGRVAIDGSQVRAVNANERTFTTDKRTQRIRQIDERVDADLKGLERSDAQDDRGTVGGAHAKALAAKIEARKQRQLHSESAQAPLRSSDQEPRSRTAPDRRAMTRGQGRGTEVCDHVQTAVNAKHQLIVAGAVTNEPGDRDWLSPMALQAKEVLGCRCDAVADVGDDHGHDVQAC